MRDGGTSRKAPSSAPNSRVSVRSSAASAWPASTTRTSNCLKRASRSCRPASAASVWPGALADVLALAAVDDQRDDALQRLALLVEQHRVEQRERPAPPAPTSAQQRAALARDHRPASDQQRRAAPRMAASSGQESSGSKASDQFIAHCPSRSSSTGTCTWSAL